MATKSELRNFATRNNCTIAEAREHFINAAKQQRSNLPTHIQYAKQGQKLVSFYWGYRADQGNNGFEFSNMTAKQIGLGFDESNRLAAIIKKAVDHQLLAFVEDRIQQEFGMSRAQFIQEEKTRLAGTTHNLNILTDGFWSLQDIMQDLIIWACAVSTLVAAGEIPQDDWNGDRFGYLINNAVELV